MFGVSPAGPLPARGLNLVARSVAAAVPVCKEKSQRQCLPVGLSYPVLTGPSACTVPISWAGKCLPRDV